MSDTAILIIVLSVVGFALLLFIIHIFTHTWVGDAFKILIDGIIFVGEFIIQIFIWIYQLLRWIFELFVGLFEWIFDAISDKWHEKERLEEERREEEEMRRIEEEIKLEEERRRIKKQEMKRKKKEKEKRKRQEREMLMEQQKANDYPTKTIQKENTMAQNFSDKEDALYEDWYNSYSAEEQKNFCFDGLMFGRNDDRNAEAEKWLKAKRRVLFLMKDTNDNPGDDIRWWPLGNEKNPDGSIKPTHRFYIVLFKWLWALNEVTADHLPVFDKSKDEYVELARKYPMAQVNVKKLSGGAQVNNDEVIDFYNRDERFVNYQIRELLNPNIIVCGGGSGTLTDIVLQRIYGDKHFEQINTWCFYCAESDLLVIDSYHPSARVCNEDKFDEMIANVQQVYKLKESFNH